MRRACGSAVARCGGDAGADVAANSPVATRENFGMSPVHEQKLVSECQSGIVAGVPGGKPGGTGEGESAVTTTQLEPGNGPAEREPETRPRRLLIADHAATRMGIRLALGEDTVVCAEAGDAESAIRAAKREQPDVALVGCERFADWRLIVRGIRRAAPDCAVVVLAPARDVDDMLESVRAGAIGYVPGMLSPERLRTVIAAAAKHEAVIPRSMVMALLGDLRSGEGDDAVLTGREAQVLGMLRRGHSTADIAGRLRIAPVTVRRHISELVHKLGVESRSDLVERPRSY